MDNQALHQSRYMMGGLVDDKGYMPTAVTDYGYMQMGSGAVTRRSFFPSVGETWDPAVGVDSVTFIASRKYFGIFTRAPTCPKALGGATVAAKCCDSDGSCTDGDDDWCCGEKFFCSNNGAAYAAAKGGVYCDSKHYGAIEEPVLTPIGFRETTAFCKYGSSGANSSGGSVAREFSPCNMSLELPLARQLLDTFSDTALVSTAVAPPSLVMTRGHHALMTFYNQPFISSDYPTGGQGAQEACEEAASTIVAEFSRTTAEVTPGSTPKKLLTIIFKTTLSRWTKTRSSTDPISGIETLTTTTHPAYCEDLSSAAIGGSASAVGGSEWWATQIFTNTAAAGNSGSSSNTTASVADRVRSLRHARRLLRLHNLFPLEDQEVLDDQKTNAQVASVPTTQGPQMTVAGKGQRRLANGNAGSMLGSMKQAAQYQGQTFVQGPEVLGKQGGMFTTQSAGALLVSGYEDSTVNRLRAMGVDLLLETDAVNAATAMVEEAKAKETANQSNASSISSTSSNSTSSTSTSSTSTSTSSTSTRRRHLRERERGELEERWEQEQLLEGTEGEEGGEEDEEEEEEEDRQRRLAHHLTADRLRQATAVLAKMSRSFALPYCYNYSWEQVGALDQLAPGGLGRRRRTTTGAEEWHKGSVNEVKDGGRPSTTDTVGEKTHGYGEARKGTPGLAHINTLSLFDGQAAVHDWSRGGASAVAPDGSSVGVAITGSDGSQFPPMLDGVDSGGNVIEPAMSYDVWWEEPMRPMRLAFSRTMQRFGVDVRRYVLNSNGWTRFDQPGEADQYAPINLLDLSRANGGVDVFMSTPHFLYGAHEGIREGVGGLQPDEAKHSTVYDVEPVTGMLLNMRRSYQISARIERTKSDYQKLLVPHCGVAGARPAASASTAPTSSPGVATTNTGGASDGVAAGATQADAELVCSLFLPIYWVTHEGYVAPEDGEFLRDRVFHAMTWASRVVVISTFMGMLTIAMGVLLCLAGMRDRIKQQAMEREAHQSVNQSVQMAEDWKTNEERSLGKWESVALGAPEEAHEGKRTSVEKAGAPPSSFLRGGWRTKSMVAPVASSGVPAGRTRGGVLLQPMAPRTQQPEQARRRARKERAAGMGGGLFTKKQRPPRPQIVGEDDGGDGDDEAEGGKATGKLMARRSQGMEVIGTEERRQMLEQQQQPE
jgi:hypothetical protein